MTSNRAQAGAVATQQALIKALGLTYREAAKLTGINARTLWQHVAANKGSNVADWDSRPQAIKDQAIEQAKKLVNRG